MLLNQNCNLDRSVKDAFINNKNIRAVDRGKIFTKYLKESIYDVRIANLNQFLDWTLEIQDYADKYNVLFYQYGIFNEILKTENKALILKLRNVLINEFKNIDSLGYKADMLQGLLNSHNLIYNNKKGAKKCIFIFANTLRDNPFINVFFQEKVTEDQKILDKINKYILNSIHSILLNNIDGIHNGYKNFRRKDENQLFLFKQLSRIPGCLEHENVRKIIESKFGSIADYISQENNSENNNYFNMNYIEEEEGVDSYSYPVKENQINESHESQQEELNNNNVSEDSYLQPSLPSCKVNYVYQNMQPNLIAINNNDEDSMEIEDGNIENSSVKTSNTQTAPSISKESTLNDFIYFSILLEHYKHYYKEMDTCPNELYKKSIRDYLHKIWNYKGQLNNKLSSIPEVPPHLKHKAFEKSLSEKNNNDDNMYLNMIKSNTFNEDIHHIIINCSKSLLDSLEEGPYKSIAFNYIALLVKTSKHNECAFRLIIDIINKSNYHENIYIFTLAFCSELVKFSQNNYINPKFLKDIKNVLNNTYKNCQQNCKDKETSSKYSTLYDKVISKLVQKIYYPQLNNNNCNSPSF